MTVDAVKKFEEAWHESGACFSDSAGPHVSEKARDRG